MRALSLLMLHQTPGMYAAQALAFQDNNTCGVSGRAPAGDGCTVESSIVMGSSFYEGEKYRVRVKVSVVSFTHDTLCLSRSSPCAHRGLEVLHQHCA